MSGDGLQLAVKAHTHHPQITAQFFYAIFRIVHVLFYVFQTLLYELFVY